MKRLLCFSFIICHLQLGWAQTSAPADTLLPVETSLPPGFVDFAAQARQIVDPTERCAYLLEQAGQQRYYENFEKVRQALGDMPLTPSQQLQLNSVEQRLAWSKPGQQAIDFRGVTLSGDSLSLSDLRGRVVVVDVWATWCAPCLRMMPYFKQLERELQHPDLTFLSVCLGVSVEIDLWHSLAEKNQLKGNVIFIDSWTRGFAKDYHVTGVPRFLIIDREGRVVSYAAPAPKYALLRQMIRQTLDGKD